MEKLDQELLLNIVPNSPDLKKVYTRHQKLEREVENLERYASYSSAARLRQLELKKAKLKEKEQMLAILGQLKGSC